MAELASKTVRAQSLASFGSDQEPQLEALLREHEAWVREHVPDYSPRPDELAFHAQAADGAKPAVDRIVFAPCIDPFAPRLPYLHLRPGQPHPPEGMLSPMAVATLAAAIAVRENHYILAPCRRRGSQRALRGGRRRQRTR